MTDKAKPTVQEELVAALENLGRVAIVSVTGISDGITIWQVREWIKQADAALARARGEA